MCENSPGYRCHQVGGVCARRIAEYELKRPYGPPLTPTFRPLYGGTTPASTPQVVTREDGNYVEFRTEAGELHREHGPALYGPNGERAWYRHGLLHNDDGPAVWTPTRKEYWIEGRRASPEQYQQMWNHEPMGSPGAKVVGVETVVMRSTQRVAASGPTAGAPYYQVVVRSSDGHRVRFNTAVPLDERNRVLITSAVIVDHVPAQGFQVPTTRLQRVRVQVTQADFTVPDPD